LNLASADAPAMPLFIPFAIGAIAGGAAKRPKKVKAISGYKTKTGKKVKAYLKRSK
jgi:hypothetical protein